MLGGVNRARATSTAAAASCSAPRAGPRSRAEFALLGQAITGALAVADTPRALRRAARPADAPAGEPGVALRRVRRLPRPARPPSATRSTRRSPPASRRCWTSAPAGPTGWSTSADADPRQRHRRLAALGSLDEVNTYFASDPMVAKLRSRRRRAARARRPGPRRGAGRPGQGRPQEAGRALRDRLDLYTDGGETHPARPAPVRGQHPADRPDPGPARRTAMAFAITGTDYRSPVRDAGLRGDPPVLGPAAGLGDRRGLPRRAPGRGLARRDDPGASRPPPPRRLPDLVRQAAEAALRRGLRARRPRPRRRRDPGRPAAAARGRRPAALPAGGARRGPALLGVRRGRGCTCDTGHPGRRRSARARDRRSAASPALAALAAELGAADRRLPGRQRPAGRGRRGADSPASISSRSSPASPTGS